MNAEILQSKSVPEPMSAMTSVAGSPVSIEPLNRGDSQPQLFVMPDAPQATKGFDHSQSLISYVRERRSDMKKLGKAHGGKVAAGAKMAILTDFLGANITNADRYETKYAPLAAAIDRTSIDQDADGHIKSVANRLRSVSKLGAEKTRQATILVRNIGHTATTEMIRYVNGLPDKFEDVKYRSAETARRKTAKARYLGRIGLSHMVIAGQARSQEIQANFNSSETEPEDLLLQK